MFRLSRCLLLLGLAYGVTLIAQSTSDKAQPNPPSGAQSAASSSATTPPEKSTSALPAQPSDVAPDPLGEARALTRKGNFDAAIEKYHQLLMERPKSPDAYVGLTRVYLEKSDVAQAYETVTHGLQVTDSWLVHVALGEVYFRQGKISDAEKEWVEVINSGHPAARAYFGLARVRWAISKNKSAKAMIEKAHTLDSRDPDIERYWINTLSRRERIQNLENYLSTAASDDSDRAPAQRYLDYLKARTGSNLTCALVNKVSSVEIPLVRMHIDPEHVRGVGLSVLVNGEKSRLLLDTGASGILLNRGMAERAGVTKLLETRIGGIGDRGSKPGYVGLATSIRIGDLEFRNCPVGVVETRSVLREDGLIGADVFEHFLVDIDFPAEKLRLQELPKRPGEIGQEISLSLGEESKDAENPEDPTGSSSERAASVPPHSGPEDRYIAPEMQSYTPVYRFGHDLLVSTKVGDAPEKLFLLDTGSEDNRISVNAAREVTKVGRDPAVLKGLSGSVSKVYYANKAVLQFGHLRQENQDMLAFDLTSTSDDAGTEISGILGFTLLRLLEVKIDYRDGLVDFKYDPKRLIHF
jgi:tetratricopeptide (TPR) repeat protein